MVTGVVLESVGCVVALGALAAPGTAGAANTAGASDTVSVSSCNQKNTNKSEFTTSRRDKPNRPAQQRGSASGCGKQRMLFVGSQQAGRTGPKGPGVTGGMQASGLKAVLWQSRGAPLQAGVH